MLLYSLSLCASVTIFEEAGATVDKMTASLVVSAWRVLISVGSSVALLKLPRRPLFLSTTLLVCINMFSLGLFFYLRAVETYQQYFDRLNWVPLLLVMLIFAGGQLGFSPIIKVQHIVLLTSS